MAYLKSQHRASMTDETMVSNIGAKDFPDPTDNPERPLEKLEIDPEVALGHELSYGYWLPKCNTFGPTRFCSDSLS